MKERPMPCYAHEVRSILDGRQSQLRRVMKAYQIDSSPGWWFARVSGGVAGWQEGEPIASPMAAVTACPYGAPGDRLWVRETWADPNGLRLPAYQADQATAWKDLRWRPSIHMPRWASRITLEVTGVRVERVQDISEADVWAEGITAADVDIGHPGAAFAALWDSINAARGYGWDTNPYVWVVEFRKIGA